MSDEFRKRGYIGNVWDIVSVISRKPKCPYCYRQLSNKPIDEGKKYWCEKCNEWVEAE